MADVSLRALRKTFDRTEAVRGIDLEIEDNELVVLVGPSGCGKSTTLRMIAGLEEVTSGEILIGGELVNDVPPKNRDIAMVFQNYALYPHMTVAQNMSFGLRLRKYPKGEIDRRVSVAADILGIDELLERRPRQLSGGQRQRVAMGRAIVRNPRVFLFDEPLSNLDAKLRGQMRTEIKRLHQRLRTTTIYVTHDQVEAMTLADRVVVMRDGVIEQIGPPGELYHNPRTRFVAGFIGSPAMNFVDCRLVKAGGALAVDIDGLAEVPLDNAANDRYGAEVGRPLVAGFRPEHIREWRGEEDGRVRCAVTPDVVEPLGIETMVYLRMMAPNSAPACSPNRTRNRARNSPSRWRRAACILSTPTPTGCCNGSRRREKSRGGIGEAVQRRWKDGMWPGARRPPPSHTGRTPGGLARGVADALRHCCRIDVTAGREDSLSGRPNFSCLAAAFATALMGAAGAPAQGADIGDVEIVALSPPQVAPSSPRSRAAIARTEPFLRTELARAGLKFGAPVFLRIFKQEKALELWVEARGRYRLFKTYPICVYSGGLGPKLRTGDLHSPEGFYDVGAENMNPLSRRHLSFDLGFPNAYDRAHGRTAAISWCMAAVRRSVAMR